MEPLSAENLMKSDNPILHRILQLLDFFSLEAYSLAIADTKLRNLLNISFDLDSKLKPWTHNEQHPPLRLYWRYDSYDIADSFWCYQTCKCRYCSELICCTHDWYNMCTCTEDCYCQNYCSFFMRETYSIERITVTPKYRKIITKILEYRKHYIHPYTRSQGKKKRSRIIRYSQPKCQSLCKGI